MLQARGEREGRPRPRATGKIVRGAGSGVNVPGEQAGQRPARSVLALPSLSLTPLLSCTLADLSRARAISPFDSL